MAAEKNEKTGSKEKTNPPERKPTIEDCFSDPGEPPPRVVKDRGEPFRKIRKSITRTPSSSFCTGP
jgi:hypothetical protein